MPRGTTVEQLAHVGLSPGLMSAGLGSVPAEQTYLDLGQGNRVFDSLYDTDLPPLGPDCAALEAVVDRADSAPADIVPGLLTSTLRGHLVAVLGRSRASCGFGLPYRQGWGAGFKGVLDIADLSLAKARSLAVSGDLVIAIEKPPPAEDEALAIGIAGPGFDGNLTSDSTRLDGYVLSTDVAPTILEFFDVPIPSEMSGQPIRAEGDVDPAAVEALGERLKVIPERRGPVIGFALLAWAVILALVAAVSRGALARPGVRLAGLSVIYLPLALLLAAALEPNQGIEQLLTIFGAPLFATATLAALGGFRALAVGAGATVAAYAIDVIVGSPLTSLSLLGPNPGLGVRFFGIGNELEALLSVLVLAGTGAALAGFAPRASRHQAAATFLIVGLAFAFVFGAGRFGADVGAAIVLPLGAAVAAATMTASRSPRAALLVLATPVAVVALLALVDLVSGANAHLTRSVLDAGGFGDLADVVQRRLQLSAHTFVKPVVFLYLPLLAAVLAWALLRRHRLEAWLRPAGPALRAGLAGAGAAVLLGTLANDSGGIVLEIGSVFLLVFVGYAWAEAGDPAGRYP